MLPWMMRGANLKVTFGKTEIIGTLPQKNKTEEYLMILKIYLTDIKHLVFTTDGFIFLLVFCIRSVSKQKLILHCL